MMFCLKTQVPLHIDLDGGVDPAHLAPDLGNVLANKLKLPGRVCFFLFARVRKRRWGAKSIKEKNTFGSRKRLCSYHLFAQAKKMNIQYRDALWHVLYGLDTQDLAACCNIVSNEQSAADIYISFIKAIALPSAKRMAEHGRSDDLLNLLRDTKALTQCRAIFFLLLNVDEEFRRIVCDPEECLGLNIGTAKVAPLCPYKAERFFRDLDTKCVHAWLRNETKSISVFLEELRMLYLVS